MRKERTIHVRVRVPGTWYLAMLPGTVTVTIRKRMNIFDIPTVHAASQEFESRSNQGVEFCSASSVDKRTQSTFSTTL
jgi:hypothetical protein